MPNTRAIPQTRDVSRASSAPMSERDQTPAGVPTRAELAAAIAGALPESKAATVDVDELAGAALALVLERHRTYRNARKRASRARLKRGARAAA